MTIRKLHSSRVLAIDPTTHGFGFVVLESMTMPVDWGMPVIRRGDKEKALIRVTALIEQYDPNVLAIEEPQGSRRCGRVKELLEAISLIKVKGLSIRRFSIKRVKTVFRAFGAETKYEIAHAIARQVPELAAWLPRFRKPWMSEDKRTSIFDAASLALTYFHSRSSRAQKLQEIHATQNLTISATPTLTN